MNKNSIPVIAASLVAVIAISGFALYSSAATGDDNGWSPMGYFHDNMSDELKADMQARHDEMWADREERRAEMGQAFSEGYEAWRAQVEEDFPDAQRLDVINADNFEDFRAAHNKIREGADLMEEGRAEMEELGVERMGMGPGAGMGQGKHFNQGMRRGTMMHQNWNID